MTKPDIIQSYLWASEPLLPNPSDDYKILNPGQSLPAIYYRAVIHHPGNLPQDYRDIEESKRLLKQFNREHIANSWGCIGYHYAVDQLGNIFQCRNIAFRGCHVAQGNTGSLGIVLLLAGTKYAPSWEMQESLFALLAWYCDYLSILPKNIFPHSALNATDCPGAMVRKMFFAPNQLSQKIKKYKEV